MTDQNTLSSLNAINEDSFDDWGNEDNKNLNITNSDIPDTPVLSNNNRYNDSNASLTNEDPFNENMLLNRDDRMNSESDSTLHHNHSSPVIVGMNTTPTSTSMSRRASRRQSSLIKREARKSLLGGGSTAKERLLDVSTKTLEHHLSIINKTLKRHENELRNPVWMETVRNEFDSLNRLRRRMDHNESDMTSLREVVYTSGDHIFLDPEPSNKEKEKTDKKKRRKTRRGPNPNPTPAVEDNKDDNKTNEEARRTEDGKESKNEENTSETKQYEDNIQVEEGKEDNDKLLVKEAIPDWKFRGNLKSLETTLRNDIELIRNVGRRLDLHKASESVLIPHIEKLAISNGNHELRLKDLEGSDEVEKAKAELIEEIADVRDYVDDVDQDIQETQTEVYYRIEQLEHSTQKITSVISGEGEGDEFIPNLRQLQEKFVSRAEFEEGGDLRKDVDGISFILARLEKRHNRAVMEVAIDLLEMAIIHSNQHKVQYGFNVWKKKLSKALKKSLKNRKELGALLKGIVRRYMCKSYISLYFHRWQRRVDLMHLFEVKKEKLQSIAYYWRSKVPDFIDIRIWFNKWRRNSYLDLANRYNYCIEKMGNEEKDELKNIGDMTLNASNYMNILNQDNDGRTLMLGSLMETLTTRLLQVNQMSAGFNNSIINVKELMNRESSGTREELGARMNQLENALKNFRTMIESKFNKFESENDIFVKNTEDNLLDLNTNKVRHESRLEVLEKKVKTHEQKLQSSFTLQGEIMDRITKVEGMHKKLVTEVSNVRELSESAMKLAKKDADDIISSKNKLLSLIDESNGEIINIKAAAESTEMRLAAMIDACDRNEEKISKVNNVLADKIKNLHEYVRSHLKPPPSVEECVSLCGAYEAKVDNSQHMGGSANYMPSKLALQIAEFTQRLAAHIAATADIAILNVLLAGPQQAPPRSEKPAATTGIHVPRPGDMKTGGDDPLEVTPVVGAGSAEDDAFATREEMVREFLEKFSEMVEFSDAKIKPSKARLEARTIFHRRFLHSLDLALGKHDSTVMAAPSTIGAKGDGNNSGAGNIPSGVCVACDRPLRMRYRSRPISYIHSQKALLDAKIQQQNIDDRMNDDYSKLHASAYTNGDNNHLNDTMNSYNGGDYANSNSNSTSGKGKSNIVDNNSHNSRTNSRPASAHASMRTGNANQYGHTSNSVPGKSSTGLMSTERDSSSIKYNNNSNNLNGNKNNRRPKSAGALRHKQAVKTAAIGDAYIMKAGFRMPVVKEQELLASKLANRFPKDWSHTKTHQIYPVKDENNIANMTDDIGVKDKDYNNQFDSTFKRPEQESFDFGPEIKNENVNFVDTHEASANSNNDTSILNTTNGLPPSISTPLLNPTPSPHYNSQFDMSDSGHLSPPRGKGKGALLQGSSKPIMMSVSKSASNIN